MINLGLFDYVKNELFCCVCGYKQKGFQTKSFRRCMDELDITKIKGIEYNFYTICTNCNNWIEIHVGVNGIHTLEEGQKQKIKQRKDLQKMLRKK